jgi:hypothetical protein
MSKDVAVCPRCRRVPTVSKGGFYVCGEHGVLVRVETVQTSDTTRSRKREDDVDGTVIGKCSAVIRSVNSSGRGTVCGRPARYWDGSQPRCGIHEPDRLEKRINRVWYPSRKGSR